MNLRWTYVLARDSVIGGRWETLSRGMSNLPLHLIQQGLLQGLACNTISVHLFHELGRRGHWMNPVLGILVCAKSLKAAASLFIGAFSEG
jgi:hypothetical protein